MHILALNCGSSSIKSAVIDTATGERILHVMVEEIGSAAATLAVNGQRKSCECSDVQAASERLLEQVRAAHKHVDAVAHRIVHGGTKFVCPTTLDDAVLKQLEELNELAPLHNPPALAAVSVARRVFDAVPHVAVFDTAFHATLPPRAREYALPRDIAEKYGLRRFGFHGTSHAHIMRAVADELGAEPERLRIISCHLGNGASVAAIEYGRSVETSMGMTPLEGLVMGSRSGDIDPGILLRLLGSGDYDVARLDALLNKQSGLKGLTGTNDLRDIEQRAARGDEVCGLAISIYAHRIRKYIGAYAAVMGGVDAIAFTGGVGEHSPLIRHRVLQRFDFLGVTLDEDKNRDVTQVASIVTIAAAESRVQVLVVAANEELSIARETAAHLS
jgi:acetate kinase